MDKLIDLRSDTVTRPTEGMRRAIYEAEVGDDVFGDDPTVNRLQEKAAEILGKEAGLFVPSGTMANQVSIASHTSPGDEVYCEEGCHMLNFEGGAPAHLSGVILSPIPGTRGVYRTEQVRSKLRPSDHHFAVSKLIWVENTANRAGGCIFPQDECWNLRKLADESRLKMHLDGARLWNAAAATGLSEKTLAEPFDSVSVCLSKGLGAPVGSIVLGSREFIDSAHRFRKRFGGGMRQAGILAAAGLYALEHHRERLVDDHRRAHRLAHAIADLPDFSIDLEAIHTNIVVFDASPGGRTGKEIAATLKQEGMLVTDFGTKVRLVTHLDITDSDIDRTVEILRKKFG